MGKVSKVNIIKDTRRSSSDIQSFSTGKRKKFPKHVLKQMSLSQLTQAIRLVKEGKL